MRVTSYGPSSICSVCRGSLPNNARNATAVYPDSWSKYGLQNTDNNSSSNAQGECREIKTVIDVMEYLESTKGQQKLEPQWKIMKSIKLESSNALFYLDTKFTENYLRSG